MRLFDWFLQTIEYSITAIVCIWVIGSMLMFGVTLLILVYSYCF